MRFQEILLFCLISAGICEESPSFWDRILGHVKSTGVAIQEQYESLENRVVDYTSRWEG